jgi:hypothetical protein
MFQTNELYDSAARPHPAIEEFFSLVKYRDVLGQLVRRDIVTRYKDLCWELLDHAESIGNDDRHDHRVFADF